VSNGKLWYRFDGSLWQEDSDAILLRHDLSTLVRDQFMAVFNRLVAPSFHYGHSADPESDPSDENLSVTRATTETLLKIARKLQDTSFKDGVLREMREYLYDKTFLKRVDSDPNLLAFTNGAWDLRAGAFRPSTPEDCLSMSVGYAYDEARDEGAAAMVETYWRTLHPDPAQRAYVQMMLARQLYGDFGMELFHVHAGHQASACNGKTRFFDIMERCLGSYVRKFGIEVLTARQRPEPGKPMPEYAGWRGVRILYCSEPNQTDALNSGILKDLTGGEAIMYRLLFSNDVQQFRPQFKIHMLCNDTPRLDGGDSGVQRRTRKIDYISRFVTEREVDPERHHYARDPDVIKRFEDTVAAKLEFVKLLLGAYEHGWQFEMPSVVLESSKEYIEDNDAYRAFVRDHIEPNKGKFFTLQTALAYFKGCTYYNHQPKAFKTALERLLGVASIKQKVFKNRKYTSVFEGFVLQSPDGDLDDPEVDDL
jgi:phage/plasmid-associated DNA primase